MLNRPYQKDQAAGGAGEVTNYLELAELLEKAARALREAHDALAAIPSSGTLIYEGSVRAQKILERLGVTTYEQLSEKTEDDVLGIRNSGKTVVAELRQLLKQKGMTLKGDAPQ